MENRARREKEIADMRLTLGISSKPSASLDILEGQRFQIEKLEKEIMDMMNNAPKTPGSYPSIFKNSHAADPVMVPQFTSSDMLLGTPRVAIPSVKVPSQTFPTIATPGAPLPSGFRGFGKRKSFAKGGAVGRVGMRKGGAIEELEEMLRQYDVRNAESDAEIAAIQKPSASSVMGDSAIGFFAGLDSFGTTLMEGGEHLRNYADPLIDDAMKRQTAHKPTKGFKPGNMAASILTGGLSNVLESLGIDPLIFLEHAGLTVADVASSFAGGFSSLAGLGVKAIANPRRAVETIGNIISALGEGETYESVGSAARDYFTGDGIKEDFKSGALFRGLATTALEFTAASRVTKVGTKLSEIGLKSAYKTAAKSGKFIKGSYDDVGKFIPEKNIFGGYKKGKLGKETKAGFADFFGETGTKYGFNVKKPEGLFSGLKQLPKQLTRPGEKGRKGERAARLKEQSRLQLEKIKAYLAKEIPDDELAAYGTRGFKLDLPDLMAQGAASLGFAGREEIPMAELFAAIKNKFKTKAEGVTKGFKGRKAQKTVDISKRKEELAKYDIGDVIEKRGRFDEFMEDALLSLHAVGYHNTDELQEVANSMPHMSGADVANFARDFENIIGAGGEQLDPKILKLASDIKEFDKGLTPFKTKREEMAYIRAKALHKASQTIIPDKEMSAAYPGLKDSLAPDLNLFWESRKGEMAASQLNQTRPDIISNMTDELNKLDITDPRYRLLGEVEVGGKKIDFGNRILVGSSRDIIDQHMDGFTKQTMAKAQMKNVGTEHVAFNILDEAGKKPIAALNIHTGLGNRGIATGFSVSNIGDAKVLAQIENTINDLMDFLSAPRNDKYSKVLGNAVPELMFDLKDQHGSLSAIHFLSRYARKNVDNITKDILDNKGDLSDPDFLFEILKERNIIRDKFGFATGGPVQGPGTATSDSIPAMLSQGEYVVKTDSAKKIGYNNLEAMNQTGRVPKFSDGGVADINKLEPFRKPGKDGYQLYTDANGNLYEPDGKRVEMQFGMGGLRSIPKALAKMAGIPLNRSDMPIPEELIKTPTGGKFGGAGQTGATDLNKPSSDSRYSELGLSKHAGFGQGIADVLDVLEDGDSLRPDIAKLNDIKQVKSMSTALTSSTKNISKSFKAGKSFWVEGPDGNPLRVTEEDYAANVGRFSDGGVADFFDYYTKISKNSVDFSGLESDDQDKFLTSTSLYLQDNPIALRALEKGYANVTTMTGKQLDAVYNAADSAGAYDHSTGSIIINEDLFKGSRLPGFKAPYTPKAATEGDYGAYQYLMSHEFGHLQDSLIRGALDSYMESTDTTSTDLPEYVQDMLKVMSSAADSKNAVSGYAKASFDAEGIIGGVAENLADIEAISELGGSSKKMKGLISAYDSAFSAEKQEMFLADFGDYLGNRHDLQSVDPEHFGMGGMVRRKHFANGSPGGVARKFSMVNGQLVELDEDGNVIGNVGGTVTPDTYAANVTQRPGMPSLEDQVLNTILLSERDKVAGKPRGMSNEERTKTKALNEKAKSLANQLKESDTAGPIADNFAFDARRNLVFYQDEETGQRAATAYQSRKDLRDPWYEMKAKELGVALRANLTDTAGGAAKERYLGDFLKPGTSARGVKKALESKAYIEGPKGPGQFDKLEKVMGDLDNVLENADLSEKERVHLNKVKAQGKKLLETGDLSSFKDQQALGDILRDTAIPETSRMLKDKVKADLFKKYGIDNYVLAHMGDPESFDKAKSIIDTMEGGEKSINAYFESRGGRLPQATLETRSAYLQDELNKHTTALSKESISAQGLHRDFEKVQDKEFKDQTDLIFGKLAGQTPLMEAARGNKGILAKIIELLTGKKPSTKDNADEAEKRNKEAAAGFDSMFGDIPGFATGGIVGELHKGEAVLPKPLTDTLMAASNQPTGGMQKIEVDVSAAVQELKSAGEELASQLKGIKIEVEEPPLLKVEEQEPLKVEDKEFVAVLEDPTVEVNVDTAKISSAISDALASVQVDTGTAAVGADSSEALDRVKEMHDEIINLKGNIEEKIEIIKEDSVSEDTMTAEITKKVSDAMDRVNNDITLAKDDIQGIKDKVSGIEQSTKSEIMDVRRLANESLNFSTRPGI